MSGATQAGCVSRVTVLRSLLAGTCRIFTHVTRSVNFTQIQIQHASYARSTLKNSWVARSILTALKLHLKAKFAYRHSAYPVQAAFRFIKREPVRAVSSPFNRLLQFLPSSSCQLSHPYRFSFSHPCCSFISQLRLIFHIPTELACRISCVAGLPLLHSHHFLDVRILWSNVCCCHTAGLRKVLETCTTQ